MGPIDGKMRTLSAENTHREAKGVIHEPSIHKAPTGYPQLIHSQRPVASVD